MRIGKFKMDDLLNLGVTCIFLYQLTSQDKYWIHVVRDLIHELSAREISKYSGLSVSKKITALKLRKNESLLVFCWGCQGNVSDPTSECYHCASDFCSPCWDNHDCPHIGD